MKFVFLHGLGQTAQDWQAVIHQSSLFDVDCPELFSFAENAFTYSGICLVWNISMQMHRNHLYSADFPLAHFWHLIIRSGIRNKYRLLS